jgi:hypothetical protein
MWLRGYGTARISVHSVVGYGVAVLGILAVDIFL